MTQRYENHPAALDQIQLMALVIGALGTLALIVGGFVTHWGRDFFIAYLFAFMFCIGVPLGCLGMLTLQHLTGGAWALIIRRPLEAATRMFPLTALLFIPLVFGERALYAWMTDAEAQGVGKSALRVMYLHQWFWIIRSAVYFAIWLIFSFFLNHYSRVEDRDGHERVARKFQLLSGSGLLLYGLTATYAVIDWVMSLDPRWISTVYGMIFVAGQGLAALTFCAVIAWALSRDEGYAAILRPPILQDLGNLTLAFVMIWAYTSVSQLIIVWSGNISDETSFYAYRIRGGWTWLAGILIVCHFFVPFCLLLNRPIKRRIQILASVGIFILLMRLLDLYWLVVPQWDQGHVTRPIPRFHIHWLDIAAPIGMGGIWLAVYIWQLKRMPIIPVHDPRLREEEVSHA